VIVQKIILKKDKVQITHDTYLHPKTNPLVFKFSPAINPEINERSAQTQKKCLFIDHKPIFFMDHFFNQEELISLRNYSLSASFSNNIYGSTESISDGEIPAKAMNSQERWHFFTNPPLAVNQLFHWLSHLAAKLNVEIMTLPWELSNDTTNSPAIATNFLYQMSTTSSQLGIHKDYEPEKLIPFAIPQLYNSSATHFANQFINGAAGHPWMVTIMLYAAHENFEPGYGMGTLFYDDNKQLKHRVDCQHGRIVLFEGDIFHSIEPSFAPPSGEIWRLSYVFKLIFNPNSNASSVRSSFTKSLEELTT